MTCGAGGADAPPAPFAKNNQRGIDQDRQDRQPFMYDGQQVTPDAGC
jgi:hypothetical protein